LALGASFPAASSFGPRIAPGRYFHGIRQGAQTPDLLSERSGRPQPFEHFRSAISRSSFSAGLGSAASFSSMTASRACAVATRSSCASSPARGGTYPASRSRTAFPCSHFFDAQCSYAAGVYWPPRNVFRIVWRAMHDPADSVVA
jgi:hypothetical protein